MANTPTRLGRYEDLQLLGEGGMGAVYRARDPSLDRVVAIKVMHDATPEFVARFRREARAIARLSHPNVVQVHDFGEVDADGHASPYFVMELLKGRSLDKLLDELGALPATEVMRILEQAARGLGAAHAAGIVHRDIKPANLVLDEEGHLKIVDFGIARMEEGSNALTRPQALIGTPLYMSPEVLNGEVADGRADLYALGLTAFHLLAGQPPFDAPSSLALAIKHMSEPLPDLAALAPGTPEPLVRLIRRMSEKKREARVQSCEELLTDLRAIQSPAPLPSVSEPPRAPIAEREPPPRNGLVLAGVAGALVLAVGLGVGMKLRGSRHGAGKTNSTTNGALTPDPKRPVASLGANGPVRVAVLLFKNLGGDKDLDVLTEGIGETVVSTLGQARAGFTLVERNQVEQAVREIDFERSKYVDQATAAALGRVSGVDVVVQGGYQRAAGALRVSARFIRVETGEILDTMVLTRPADDLFAAQDAVAAELRARLARLVTAAGAKP